MTDEQVIASQARQIEKMSAELSVLRQCVRRADGIMFGIGGPLNDNKLGFTAEQRTVFHRIADALGADSLEREP